MATSRIKFCYMPLCMGFQPPHIHHGSLAWNFRFYHILSCLLVQSFSSHHVIPLGIEFQLPSYYHTSGHEVLAPIYTFGRVWFLYGYNMPLGTKSHLPLYCSYVELSSQHIIAGLLAHSWAPILLQYIIHSCFSKWSCVVIYGHLWACVVMCSHVCSCIFMYGHVSSCIVLWLVSCCVIMCDQYQDKA